MDTRASLLLRVKDPTDSHAWGEFHDLYAPLIYNYARARGLGHDDAEEVRSACYETLARQIGSFEYDKRKGGFKAWLRTLVQRRVVDLWRKRREVNANRHVYREPPVDEVTPDDAWDREWRNQHLVHCVEQARALVTADQHKAFILLVREGRAVTAVADELRMNANQVYKAKARVLSVVRELMAKLYSEIES